MSIRAATGCGGIHCTYGSQDALEREGLEADGALVDEAPHFAAVCARNMRIVWSNPSKHVLSLSWASIH